MNTTTSKCPVTRIAPLVKPTFLWLLAAYTSLPVAIVIAGVAETTLHIDGTIIALAGLFASLVFVTFATITSSKVRQDSAAMVVHVLMCVPSFLFTLWHALNLCAPAYEESNWIDSWDPWAVAIESAFLVAWILLLCFTGRRKQASPEVFISPLAKELHYGRLEDKCQVFSQNFSYTSDMLKLTGLFASAGDDVYGKSEDKCNAVPSGSEDFADYDEFAAKAKAKAEAISSSSAD